MQERKYGFRTGRSPILRLLKTLSERDIFRMLNALHSSFSTFKRRLIRSGTASFGKKIEKLDPSAKFYKLLESYLCNRYMRVQIDDALSESSKVEKGVPQGSFLGLFFCVIYRPLAKCLFIFFFIRVCWRPFSTIHRIQQYLDTIL